jgi:GT2 family glycosyltransferase
MLFVLKETNMLAFSVIIPTCNRPELLAKCLQQLAPGVQTMDSNRYEVIVTDDSVGNETEAMVKESFPWVRYTRGPRRGPAANRNHGATLSEAPWLVFTDDDCLPEAGWLQAYANAIQQHPNGKAFEGAILPDDWTMLKKDMAECPVNTTGAMFWSANIMVEKKLYDQVGGFDERFRMPANEDQEIYGRLQRQGKVVFFGDAIVVHPVRMVPLLQKVRKLPLAERSQITLRHLQGYSHWQNWSDGLAIHCRAFIDSIKKWKWKRAFYNCLGFLYRLLFGYQLIIQESKQKRNDARRH